MLSANFSVDYKVRRHKGMMLSLDVSTRINISFLSVKFRPSVMRNVLPISSPCSRQIN